MGTASIWNSRRKVHQYRQLGDPKVGDETVRLEEWDARKDLGVYANSEDGNLYAIAQGEILKQSLFLNLALGAAYTPVSIGPATSTARTSDT